MTAKEKAKELVDKFFPLVSGRLTVEEMVSTKRGGLREAFLKAELKEAKQCALIHLDLLIEEIGDLKMGEAGVGAISKIYYLEEVKNQIQLL